MTITVKNIKRGDILEISRLFAFNKIKIQYPPKN